MIRIGYKKCKYDCYVYVDDMLIVAKSMSEANKLKILLSREFDMKDLGASKKILGIEIRRERALGRL